MYYASITHHDKVLMTSSYSGNSRQRHSNSNNLTAINSSVGWVGSHSWVGTATRTATAATNNTWTFNNTANSLHAKLHNNRK